MTLFQIFLSKWIKKALSGLLSFCWGFSDADELIWVLLSFHCRRKSISAENHKTNGSFQLFWTRKFTNPFLSGDEMPPKGTSTLGSRVTFFSDQSMSCFQYKDTLPSVFTRNFPPFIVEPWGNQVCSIHKSLPLFQSLHTEKLSLKESHFSSYQTKLLVRLF